MDATTYVIEFLSAPGGGGCSLSFCSGLGNSFRGLGGGGLGRRRRRRLADSVDIVRGWQLQEATAPATGSPQVRLTTQTRKE